MEVEGRRVYGNRKRKISLKIFSDTRIQLFRSECILSTNIV